MENTLTVQLPAKAKFGGLSPILGNTCHTYYYKCKCKQSPVYGVFWPLLPHPSTDRNKTRTWSSLSPRNLPIKIGTNPSTIFLVIVVTDRQTHRQTHKPTPVKTYSLAFAGRITLTLHAWNNTALKSYCMDNENDQQAVRNVKFKIIK